MSLTLLAKRLFMVSLVVWLGAAQLSAQPTVSPAQGSLRVRVFDPSGGAIVAAAVHIVSSDGTESVLSSNEQGDAITEGLTAGTYQIRVEAPGFEVLEIKDVRVGTRRVTREARLQIARFADQVDVTQSDTDRQLLDVFSNTLTQEQIDQLPDDPEEMQQALENMAGPGARIRVDGFAGGQLPPKSQIREIRFRFDPYAAEFHEPGFPRVDIRTRLGQGSWRSSADFAFRDESLNATNAFAPYKGAEQTRRYGWTLDGPLAQGKTSFSLSVRGTSAYDSKTIVATTPTGEINDIVRAPNDRINVNARVEHALSPVQTLRFEFERSDRDQDNLGVGDFTLPERAYSQTQIDNVFRVSQRGTINKRYVNELRFQFRWQESESSSFSDAVAVDVLDEFSSGGAQMSGGRRSREIQIADDFDFSVGKKHAMRAGLLLEAGSYRGDQSQNVTGTFTFASLEAYELGLPTTFKRRTGDPLVEFSNLEFAWYLQDDIRVNRNLVISAGVRHEVQTHLDDWLNLAPRAAFTWSPFKGNRTTLRGGAGIFYDWYESSLYEQTLRVDGTHQIDSIVQNPGYPDPFAGATEIVLPPSIISAADDLIMPVVRRVSLGIEHQFAPWLRMRANAFTQVGRNELRSININAPIDGIRPDPGVGNISEINSIGRSSSRGADVGLNANYFPWRLFAAINYRYAINRNEADDSLSLPADNANPSADWGPARDDIRHLVFGMFNAGLPKGFRFGTNVRYQTGAPYNITTGFDTNGDTVSNDRPDGIGRNSARGDSQFNMDLRLGWSVSLGRQPPAGPNGPGGGPQIVVMGPGPGGGRGDGPGGGGGPGDLGRGDGRRMEIYVQALNVFNNVNYSRYSGVVTSRYFGTPTSALAPRRVEAGLRFNF